jgi:hypothetical protein
LNGRTEQDFLAIGEKLVEFVDASRHLSSDMAALNELISGTNGWQASQVLTHVLELLRRIETRAEASDRALTRVCASTGQVGRTFGDFQNTVSVFRVLGSLTRIEAARLGNAGVEFGDLAEEVSGLTRSIESSGQGIVDASAILHQKMQAALAKATGLHANELKELPAITAEVLTSLASLEDRQRRAAEASLRDADDYKDVSAAIEDLITAIQFHDITRQQIEHVADALEHLRAEFPNGRRSRAAPPDARAVLSLQSSQLSNAEQVFAASAGRIERDLDSIGGRVRNMAEASKTLMGLSAEEQDSFFVELEGRFTAILKVVTKCATVEAQIKSALAELAAAVRRMRESVADVRQVEIRIHRIAINATIRAVQIGDSGNALSVIAEVMQRLALDSNNITGEVTATLDTISDAAHSMSDGSCCLPESEGSDADGVLSEMRGAILKLHSASEATFSRLNQTTVFSTRLSEAVQSVRAGFSAGALFAEATDRARRMLQQFGGHAEPAHSENLEPAAQQRLKDYAAHYTMQTERDVHQSVAMGAAAPLAPAGAVETVPGDEGLGENVELF